ncbi:MAG: ATP-binding protein [Candidatus Omnitrophica bacterium]|nr:ATP-binding protein [Candidatus Omnitrophota bacterium]
MKNYIRQPIFDELWRNLSGSINLIQAVVGPRQVGKTTLALQILEKWKGQKLYETADHPDTPSADWIKTHWEEIRARCERKKEKGLLILDEVQKIPHWSEIVKKLFDEDKRKKNNIRILILGSSSLLMQRGLTESLAGRFELHRHYQWSFAECQDYFGMKLNEYLYFGGYPGALILRKDEIRWGRFMRDSLIETVLSKDIILLTPITKPVLLRQTFGMAVTHPAHIISYQKMLGTLQDAGNTTTIASYLHLFSKAFLLLPLERWSGSKIRQRGSIPKMMIFDNGLVTAMLGIRFREMRKDTIQWGHLIENIVGAHLYFWAEKNGGQLFYWRERQNEVDYILKIGSKLLALEVKSGIPEKPLGAFSAFNRKYKKAENYIISSSRELQIKGVANIFLEEFLKDPQKALNL